MAGSVHIVPIREPKRNDTMRRIIESRVRRAKEIAQVQGVKLPDDLKYYRFGSWHATIPWKRKEVRDIILQAVAEDRRLKTAE